jgi:hypothetical protein
MAASLLMRRAFGPKSCRAYADSFLLFPTRFMQAFLDMLEDHTLLRHKHREYTSACLLSNGHLHTQEVSKGYARSESKHVQLAEQRLFHSRGA